MPWPNCAVSTCSNGCSGFCSDSDFVARLFSPARLKSLELNWRSPPGRGDKSVSNLWEVQLSRSGLPLFLQQDHAERLLFVPVNVYCDARLLAALGPRDSSAALVDSNPPPFAKDLVQNPCGPALVTRDFPLACSDSAPFVEALKHKVETGEIDIVDAANVEDYIVSMRRRVWPLCF